MTSLKDSRTWATSGGMPLDSPANSSTFKAARPRLALLWREVKTAGGLPTKVGTTRLLYGVGGRSGRPCSRRASPWKGEYHGWSIHEGGHDSPAPWGCGGRDGLGLQSQRVSLWGGEDPRVVYPRRWA
ncbi:hypothetical protein CRG98_030162 [Punica granatum]|uniref:Uncharacterized protein n=1 Tax=Punica granatum TaxID=22663 RepID=A0A2I0J0G8_PUNGR|nr:hypothetical protein CRG98_030162 [Punica granatum]